MKRGFRIQHMLMNGHFESLNPEIADLGIALDTVSNNELLEYISFSIFLSMTEIFTIPQCSHEYPRFTVSVIQNHLYYQDYALYRTNSHFNRIFPYPN